MRSWSAVVLSRVGSELSGCLFFFQAEDGIRDIGVTGVQTCALPISYGRRQLLVGVDHGVVLHAGPRADDYLVEVPPEHGPEPDARPVLDSHVPDEHRGRRDERAGMNFGLLALERNDVGHSLSPPEPGRAPLDRKSVV